MKLETVQEVATRRKNALGALHTFLSSPVGKDVINVLKSELNILSLIGDDTHDTYLRLGKNDCLELLKRLGGLHD